MEQPAIKAQSSPKADSATRYLVRASEEERKKWGERAVALGFPRAKLKTTDRVTDLLPWYKFVEQEMREQGLWEPPQPEPENEKRTAKVIQLPLWPEPVRAVPNDILRSALFAAIQGKTRRYLKKEVLASVEGVTVSFTGGQLDQSDLDVWEQAVHLARTDPLGNKCYFRGNSFLKSIGRGNGKAQYEWLNDAINRLVACAVEIRTGSRVFTGSLLSSCCRDEKTGVYELTLDPKTVKLYTVNNWSSVEWEQRQALMGKPLALWLHGFYSSHAKPLPYKVETLRKLSGGNTKDLKQFRRLLGFALESMKTVGAIVAWSIDTATDLVTVDRGAALTDSQRRHLAKPTRRRKPKA
jgi:hypothetical protein